MSCRKYVGVLFPPGTRKKKENIITGLARKEACRASSTEFEGGRGDVGFSGLRNTSEVASFFFFGDVST